MVFCNRIELMIADLESKIPWDQTGPFYPGRIERSDWGPVWSLCKRIQEEFNNRDAFSSREAQNEAWARFSRVRKKASDLADREKKAFLGQSRKIRNDILSDIKQCRYSPLNDLVFFFNPTTVAEIKQMQNSLKEAGQKLSESKKWMIAEHKKECFEAILEAHGSINLFWEKRGQLSADRRKALLDKRQEFQNRQNTWRERVHQNICRNKEKLEKAQNALSLVQARISDLECQLTENSSEKWQGILSERISEAKEKERDIGAWIDRIRSWIEEDDMKLTT